MKFLQSHENVHSTSKSNNMYVVEMTGDEILTIRAALGSQSDGDCLKHGVSRHVNDYIFNEMGYHTGIRLNWEHNNVDN